MNKEKEIEEMAKAMGKCKRDCKTCLSQSSIYRCDQLEFAKALADAGYGNVAQTVKEFAEKLKAHQWLTCTVDKFVVYVDEIDKLINDIYEEAKERNE